MSLLTILGISRLQLMRGLSKNYHNGKHLNQVYYNNPKQDMQAQDMQENNLNASGTKS